MQRVDFYILSDHSPVERFVCQLAGKVIQSGSKLFINTEDSTHAAKLDDLLWTFQDISFIPHQLLDSQNSADTPILIGANNSEIPPSGFDVLLNLATELPMSHKHFQRILEIVGGDTDRIQAARNRYRAYRDSGFELYDHKIDNTNG